MRYSLGVQLNFEGFSSSFDALFKDIGTICFILSIFYL